MEYFDGACDIPIYRNIPSIGTLTSLIFNSDLSEHSWQANRRCRETVAATNGQRPTGDKAERTSLIFNSENRNSLPFTAYCSLLTINYKL